MNNLINIIESILFVSGNAVAIKDIADKLNVPEKQILEAAEKLKERYSGSSGLYLLIFNNKLQFSSNPAYADFVSGVLNPIREKEFTKTILEVCAIIAYKQPITKPEVEFIKGVKSCDYAFQILSSLNMIEPVGRKDAVGRPVLYATTDNFLKRFNLTALSDLPDYDLLIKKIQDMRKDGGDEYLFAKDEYEEEAAVTDVLIEEKEMPQNKPSAKKKEQDEKPQQVNKPSEKLQNDDSADIDDELEIPDFLDGEDVIHIN